MRSGLPPVSADTHTDPSNQTCSPRYAITLTIGRRSGQGAESALTSHQARDRKDFPAFMGQVSALLSVGVSSPSLGLKIQATTPMRS